jgi:crossover junction endodeoxyribonuclease RusA
LSQPPDIVLMLPWPPSVNRYWRSVVIPTKTGTRAAVLLSSEARKYKKRVEGYCTANHITPILGPVRLNVDLYRPRRIGDLDGPLKAVFDALQSFAYENDSQIVELHVRRFDDKHRPRVEIAVSAAPIDV